MELTLKDVTHKRRESYEGTGRKDPDVGIYGVN